MLNMNDIIVISVKTCPLLHVAHLFTSSQMCLLLVLFT